MLQKKIPTIFGLGVLIIALVAGVFLLGDGPGVFAPRAAPETAPKKIKVTNITDSSFTISFLTDEPTLGFVKYGTSPGDLDSQASDDRDQLSGDTGSFRTHHITVRGLSADTAYHYEIGTGSSIMYDNSGTPFKVTTAKQGGVPSAAKTVTGSVVTAAGAPAEHAIVYINTSGALGMSALVRSSGGWAIPLSNARTMDMANYALITDDTSLTIRAQGSSSSEEASATITVANAQPVPALSFATGGLVEDPGGSGAPASTPPASTPPAVTPPPSGPPSIPPVTTPPPSIPPAGGGSGGDDGSGSSGVPPTLPPLSDPGQSSGDPGGRLGSLLEQTQSPPPTTQPVEQNEVVNLEIEEKQTVTTGKPKIVGKAQPQVVITLEVNSETKIVEQIVTDADGSFELDIEALSEELEPGEHTATYTYTDPTTGEQISKTVNFTVVPDNLLAQADTGGPYGSGNPYPRPSSGASASASPSPSASPSATPNASGSAATESAGTKGNTATRSSLPSTASGVPVSGSVGTTITLLVGGLFFLISGAWSYWISKELAAHD